MSAAASSRISFFGFPSNRAVEDGADDVGAGLLLGPHVWK